MHFEAFKSRQLCFGLELISLPDITCSNRCWFGILLVVIDLFAGIFLSLMSQMVRPFLTAFQQPRLLYSNPTLRFPRVQSLQPSSAPCTKSPTYPILAVTLRLQPDLPLILLQPQLTQPNPRHRTRKNQHTRNYNSPMLDVPHIKIIRSPRGRANRRQPQRRNHIPTNAVVLVHALRVINAAIQTGHVVLREPHQCLDVQQDVERQTQDRVRRGEVLVPRACFVKLDDDEACGQRGDAEEVEERVSEGAGAFLRGGVGWLQDEGGLDGEEEACRVEQLGVLVWGDRSAV
jgi:hypothetical protein